MKQIELVELRMIQLDILKHIDEFCEENHVKYFLCGGTLIGAIRHNGYIPWDDDIDIMMLREDYERFIKLYLEKDDSKYSLHSIRNEKDFPFPFVKIDNTNTILQEQTTSSFELGVNIDVFPIDNVPNTYEQQRRYIRKMRMLYNILILKSLTAKDRKSIIKKIIVILGHLFLLPFSNYLIVSKMDKLARSYKGKSDYVACCVWGYGMKEILNHQALDQSLVHNFEQYVFKIPIGYHEYLTNIYGDYMQLPPKEQQITHHAFNAYWKKV